MFAEKIKSLLCRLCALCRCPFAKKCREQQQETDPDTSPSAPSSVEEGGDSSDKPGSPTDSRDSGASRDSRDSRGSGDPGLAPITKSPNARVEKSGGRARCGKGFSKSELQKAGLTVAEARDLGVRVDSRRRTAHQRNTEELIAAVGARRASSATAESASP